jgi:hypothetical protein
MHTPEEPEQQFEYQIHAQGPAYDQLPPHVKKAVNAAFAALDSSEFSTEDIQVFALRNTISFNQTVPSTPHPQYWARWDYTADEWKQFDKLDWGRAINMLLITAVIIVPLCTIFPAFILMQVLSTPDTAYSAFDIVMLVLLMVFVAFLLPASLLTYFIAGRPLEEARKRHRARKSGPRRVTIGTLSSLNSQGLWQAGTYEPIQEMFLNLTKVKMTENPPLLHFQRKHLEIRQSSWHETMRVLVPHGHEAEARQLVERFRAETIASNKKDYTPPEP